MVNPVLLDIAGGKNLIFELVTLFGGEWLPTVFERYLASHRGEAPSTVLLDF